MAEQRELDLLRVLRNVPAVRDLSHLDLAGKEQLRVSRVDPDVVDSQEDFSRAPKFVEARAGKTYWSPVYFRSESEPYVTLAVPVGKYAVEVTTAEVSLGAVLKMISQIEVGPGGYAYVVDSRNQLVAHPDTRMLREKRDLSALAQVQSARADRSGTTGDAPVAMVADGLGGGQVLAAHAAIAPLGWFVFVERPAADAYAPLRAPIIRSAVIFVLGLGLSILASLFLARRMVAPIRVLQEGAARIGAGDLDQPIELRTGDEIEALAAIVQSDDGKPQGVLRRPGAEGGGADPGAGGRQPRPHRGARAADGDERDPARHQQLADRHPARARHRGGERGSAVRGVRRRHLPPRRRPAPPRRPPRRDRRPHRRILPPARPRNGRWPIDAGAGGPSTSPTCRATWTSSRRAARTRDAWASARPSASP